MFDDLLYKMGIKEKSRTEKAKDAFSDTLHTIGDTLDGWQRSSREEAQRAREQADKTVPKARKQAAEAGERASEMAQEARGKASDLADTLRDVGSSAGEQASDTLSTAASKGSQTSAALLAALGALTADWDDLARKVTEELAQGTEAAGEQAGKAKQAAKKQARQVTKKRKKGYPGFWVWLLRLGVGIWFIERLRGRDLGEYIDYGAGQRLQAARGEHPMQWYRNLLDNTLIPNASLVGLAETIGSVLVALGYITGKNRRLASLLGLSISGNDMMADYQNHEERGQHLVLLLAQLLLLRTGG